MLSLNIGSGQRRFGKGWVNCDIALRPPDQMPDVCCDALALPFAGGSAQWIVLHHLLEHFGLAEAGQLIAEAHRVLQRCGSLYVFIPDLRKLAARWLTSPNFDDYHYTVNLYGAYQGCEGDRHKWGWSANGLLNFLRASARWTSVEALQGVPQLEGADIAWDWWIAGARAIK